MLLRVSNNHASLVLHLRDEDASIMRRAPGWEVQVVDRSIILAPRSGGRAINLHWSNMPGQMHAIHIHHPKSGRLFPDFFGIHDTEASVSDGDIIQMDLPPAHELPWIKPFRVGLWSQEEIREFVMQRVDSARRLGVAMGDVLKVLAIPDIMREAMDPDTWKTIIKETKEAYV